MINNLYSLLYGTIKSGWLRWTGHGRKEMYKGLIGKHEGKRPLGII
jgi:hypothetical protein